MKRVAIGLTNNPTLNYDSLLQFVHALVVHNLDKKQEDLAVDEQQKKKKKEEIGGAASKEIEMKSKLKRK